MIFESHAHYDDEAFETDRISLLSSLPEQGIGYVINVSADYKSLRNTARLMKEYSYIYGAFGIHPSETGEMDDEKFQELKTYCGLPKCVAVGEIGLDYYWPEPDKELQKEWFVKQLVLAKETCLPVIIHSREAAKDTLDILKSEHAGSTSGVIHCYSYSKESAREFLNLGYSFGIGGVITFPNAKKLREAVEYIPLDKILVETDSPYLAPVPNRGKRNCSLNIPYILKEIADIKGISVEEAEAVTLENAKRLFCIPD